jgi:Histidine kinase
MVVDVHRTQPHSPEVRCNAAFLCCLLLLCHAVKAAPEELACELTRDLGLRFFAGDDPRFADPAWDDSDWEVLNPQELPARKGIYWLRGRVVVGSIHSPIRGAALRDNPFVWPDARKDAEADSIYAAAVCAFEFYWDGKLLYRAGKVGNSRAEEEPGVLDNIFLVPAELRTPGTHLVALRMSSHHYNFPADHFGLALFPGNYRETLIGETRRAIFPLLGLTVACAMLLVAAVMWKVSDRRRTLAWCVALNGLLALFYGLISVRWLYNAPYPWLAPRYILITVVFTALCAVLLALLLEHFSATKRGRWWIALILVLSAGWLVTGRFELKALWMARGTFALALALVGWAAFQRRPTARWVFAGLAATILTVDGSARNFLSPVFLFALEGLVVVIFAAIASQSHAERVRARKAVLSAARLESELLKKNLQPHFLLNTLATIVEVIEQEPKTAVSLIEALAEEFRALSKMSGETLVPMRREIELCHAHLKVMSMRKGASCELRVERVDQEAFVPPALFHTLIENGLTHLLPRNARYDFVLREERTEESRRYTLEAMGEPVRRDHSKTIGDGTGMRYIRSRLEESFAGAWEIHAGPIEGGWKTEIVLIEREFARVP